jgi:hypothetical protein
MTLTNQNCSQEEIQHRLNLVNACYPAEQEGGKKSNIEEYHNLYYLPEIKVKGRRMKRADI